MLITSERQLTKLNVLTLIVCDKVDWRAKDLVFLFVDTITRVLESSSMSIDFFDFLFLFGKYNLVRRESKRQIQNDQGIQIIPKGVEGVNLVCWLMWGVANVGFGWGYCIVWANSI